MEFEEQAPAGESDWELRHDEASGASFYYNVRTGEATWDDPAPLQPASDAANAQQWTEAQDENGRVYYVNLQTMETSWEVPEATMAVGASDLILAPVSPASTAPFVRPSTAEQMDRLNRLLSGDDDDEDEDNGAGSGEQIPGDAGLRIIDTDHGLDEGRPLPAELSEHSDATAVHPEEMPWMMFINEGDGLPYYYNRLTGECVWEPPESFVLYHEQEEAHEAQIAPSGLMVEMEPIGSSLATDINNSDCADAKGQDVELSEDASSFEEKVRRAIDAVSKTPVGSSRLLLVRTPTERFSSRPGSRPASGDGSSRIRRASVDLVPATAPSELNAVENPSTEAPETEPKSAPSVEIAELSDSSSGVTSSMDEGFPAPEPSEEMVATDFAIAVFVEEAAVVLQCFVRCFLACRRVQRKRQERTYHLRETHTQDLDEAVNQSMSGAIANEEVSTLQHEGQHDESIAHSDALASSEPETAVGMDDMSVLPAAIEHYPTNANAMEPDLETNAGVLLDNEAATAAVTNDTAMPSEELQLVSVGGGEADGSFANTSAKRAPDQPLLTTDDGASKANDPCENVDIQELNVVNRMESAALILQCAVRCFVARHRVARKRQEQEQSRTKSDSEVNPHIDRMEDTAVGGVSLAPDISNQIEEQDEPPVIPVVNQDASSATNLTISSPKANSADANDGSGRLNIGNNDLEVTTANGESLAPITDSNPQPTTSTSSPISRAKSRESARRLPSQTPSTHLTPASKTPSVLDLVQYFPARPGRATGNAPKRAATVPNQSTAEIPRKKIAENFNSPTKQLTAEERLAQREQRKQERELLAAQACEKWVKEVEESRVIFQKSATSFQAKRQQLLDAAKAERKQPLQHLLESSSLARDLDTEECQKQSMWHSLKNGMSSVSASLDEFSADLDQALHSETFVLTMNQVCFAEIVDRTHRLQTTSERLDTQLELIDVYLVTDNPEITVPMKSFQAKYAKALRKKQQDTRRALRFWKARIDGCPRNGVPDDDDPILPGDELKCSWQHRINTHWKNLASEGQHSRTIYDLRFANGDSLLHFVVWKGWDAHVSHLISLGWDVNAGDNSVSRWTPLHEACRAGHVEICTHLLSAGARLDAVDSMGDSPLHVACRNGSLRVVQGLLSAAERTEIRTDLSHTARSSAGEKLDAPDTTASMHFSLPEFFYLRNRKHRRAIDLTKKQALHEYLEGKSGQSMGLDQRLI